MKICNIRLLMSTCLALMNIHVIAMESIKIYEEETSESKLQPNVPKNDDWSSEDEKPDEGPLDMRKFKNDLARQIFGGNSNGPVLVPSGVLDNQRPVAVKIPLDSKKALEERLFGVSAQKKAVLIKPPENFSPPVPERDDANLMIEEKAPLPPVRDEDAIAGTASKASSASSIEQTEQAESLRMAELILKNLHGPLLEVDAYNYALIMDGICLNALRRTKAIRTLSLATFLENSTLLALGHLLTKNVSIRTLDLSQSNLRGRTLDILGCALEKQRTLRTIIFPIEADITGEDITRFYTQIAQNSGLRLIKWPNRPQILPILQKLASDTPATAKSSSQPNKHAALHLGIMYRDGILGHIDEKEALKYLMISYKAHHPQAAYAIGKLYERKKDFDQALQWYGHAKNFKYLKAYAKLGNYERAIWPKGSRKEPNYEAAFLLYQKGANLEDRECFYRLGRMYETGRYVVKDLNIAGALFYKALEQGYADAIAALGALYFNPDFVGCDHNSSKLYLEWAKKFQKTVATANKHLTYLGNK